MATQSKSKAETGSGSKGSSSGGKSQASRRSQKQSRGSTRRDSEGRFRGKATLPSLNISRNQAAGALAVTAVGIGVGLLLNWLRHREDHDQYSPAAWADGEDGHHENFDRTRSAGPDAMRDEDGEDWDKVDQAVDESFPASDPPATY